VQEKTKRYDVASPKCGHTLAEWLAVRRHYGEKCLRCGATDRTLTRDRVVPLALGGADTIDNIQPLCGPCNCWKGARVIDFRDGWEEGKPVPKDFREAEGEGRWLPVNEAAQALEVSVEALRGRIKRNTVLSDLVGDKRVVWVSEPRPDTDQTTDRPRSASDALISELQDCIESLERQLEQERQANSEHRRLLSAAGVHKTAAKQGRGYAAL
jgi:5-methylcytosine-specific restriction endonuclease McrA